MKKFTIRKLIGQIHLCLGLSSGLLVFIISITGCIYVFEAEIRSLYEYPYTYVKAENHAVLPVSKLYTIGKSALKTEIKQAPKPEYQNITLYKNPQKAAYYYAYSEKQKIYHYVYINPYNGKVLKIKDLNYDFFTIIVQLHTSLLLPHAIGRQIVGASVLIFVISLISGLILWFPKSKKGIKQRFAIKWKAHWRRKNYDLHNVLGFYSFLLALIIALTGLVWSYTWVANGLDWLANGGQFSPVVKEPNSKLMIQKNKHLWDELFTQTQAKYPESQMMGIDFPSNDTTTLNLSFYPNETVYYNGIYLLFDQYSGKLIKEDSWRTQTNGQKIRNMNYDIHIGKILGLPGQILAFLASLIAASLPISGFLIWYGRKYKKSQNTDNQSVVKSLKRQIKPKVKTEV
ncbi:MAG: PepSY domain-containing protein [Microscillaceae bacterium]|jgi:uncharacterized iron-regulated membrane protein|nr:PepSY domain-containing protein [Microscillaceae bacterium]